MGAHSYLDLTLVLLGAIVLVVPLVQRIGMGSVAGYLLAGMLVGPSLLGLVTEFELVRAVAEFGVVFLLFAIGIELRPARLWRMRRLVFGLGGLQLAGTAAVLALLAALVGNGAAAALVIGAGLAMSSTALVLQALAEQRELTAPGGRAALAVLLLQDVAVAPLVSVVYLLADGRTAVPDADVSGGLQSLGLLLLFVLGGRLLLNRALPILALGRNPDILVAVALLLVLGAAWLLQFAGFSLALGAFLAGVLLADSPFRHQVVADIHPFRGILLGLFFVSVGMSIDGAAAVARIPELLTLVVGMMLVKAVLLGAAGRLFGLATPDAARLGLQLAQGGEFALVLFALAAEQRLIDAGTRELLIEVVALSLLLSAPVFRLAEAVARRLAHVSHPPPQPLPDDPELHGHVLLCGYGRVGAQLANLLDGAGMRWLAIELRAETVENARLAGQAVFYGDAARPEILRALRAGHAALVVVTLDDPDAAERCLHALRGLAPHCRVVMRAPDLARAQGLQQQGATRAVPETAEYSLQLGLAVLAAIGLDDVRLQQLEDGYRDNDYARLLRARPATGRQ